MNSKIISKTTLVAVGTFDKGCTKLELKTYKKCSCSSQKLCLICNSVTNLSQLVYHSILTDRKIGYCFDFIPNQHNPENLKIPFTVRLDTKTVQVPSSHVVHSLHLPQLGEKDGVSFTLVAKYRFLMEKCGETSDGQCEQYCTVPEPTVTYQLTEGNNVTALDEDNLTNVVEMHWF
jgi:hypothetical protein